MKATKSANHIMNQMSTPGMQVKSRLPGGTAGSRPVEPPTPHYPAPPKPKGGYRYETALETIRKIVTRLKNPAQPKPAEGLVPIASRQPNDMLNQPADEEYPNYCEDWYLGCPLCFRFQEGDPEVQAALSIDLPAPLECHAHRRCSPACFRFREGVGLRMIKSIALIARRAQRAPSNA
jgi:hypothetical protein